MELQLEELEAAATEDELAAEKAAAASSEPRRCAPSPARSRRASRSRRICRASGSSCLARPPAPAAARRRLAKLGEDVTETLEVVPRQWKVVQHVREKFTCRDCEKISQAPAPFHVLPRGFAGPSLLAMILFEKYGQHQPLNRQSERYAREGIDLSVSTLADQVGGCAAAAAPALRAQLRQGQPCICGISAMQGFEPFALVVGSARRFAIDRDELVPVRPERRDPAVETAAE